jgi:hypothetical protein
MTGLIESVPEGPKTIAHILEGLQSVDSLLSDVPVVWEQGVLSLGPELLLFDLGISCGDRVVDLGEEAIGPRVQPELLVSRGRIEVLLGCG